MYRGKSATDAISPGAAGVPSPALTAVLCAAICRSLERKWRIFFVFVFSCQRGGRRFAAELCSASAKRAKPACEPGLVLQIM
jgi:hypothetical protein